MKWSNSIYCYSQHGQTCHEPGTPEKTPSPGCPAVMVWYVAENRERDIDIHIHAYIHTYIHIYRCTYTQIHSNN